MGGELEVPGADQGNEARDDMKVSSEAARVDLLRGVDALFAEDRNWCKYRRMNIDSNGQVSYCLVGALFHVAAEQRARRWDVTRVMWALRRQSGVMNLRWFNDRPSTSIRDVRRLVKETLAITEPSPPEALDGLVPEPAEGVSTTRK